MMNADNDAYEILIQNVGFVDPLSWIDLARELGFKKVKATRIERCPDCGTPTRALQMGQYVYYSTLHRLVACPCGLIYADAQVDPEVLSQHFEGAYKDAGYFQQRDPIFRQLAGLVERHTRVLGTVLDVGGATGQLITAIRRRRFDLRYALSDVSAGACREAEQHLQPVTTYHGTVPDLATQSHARFDTVVCSDVLYYESDVRGMWQALAQITAPGGTVIIRIPNKLWYIRLRQWLRGVVLGVLRRDPFTVFLQTDLPGFNPEHRTILTTAYVQDRLQRHGFTRVKVLASPPLLPRRLTALAPLLGALGEAVAWLTRGRVILTPAMVLVATRSAP